MLRIRPAGQRMHEQNYMCESTNAQTIGCPVEYSIQRYVRRNKVKYILGLCNLRTRKGQLCKLSLRNVNYNHFLILLGKYYILINP